MKLVTPPRLAVAVFLLAPQLWFPPGANAHDKTAHVFEKDVRPILKAHCFHCHGEEGVKEGGLDVRLRRLLQRGGESGAAITPGDADNSLFFQRIVQGEMPPEGGRLPPAEIAVIRAWIDGGASVEQEEPDELGDSYLTAAERNFWAFQPIVRPPLPTMPLNFPLRTEVDSFVGKRLEDAGLAFSGEASKRVLVRRLSFDLLGLPPSPELVAEFLADDSADAYERLVDSLLASPRYGERWGRHWLDVAGYADSEGYVDSDPVREWAYRYRDYVIRSFNENKPFSEFVIQQLAGDELVAPPHSDLSPNQIEQLTATGFLRTAPDGTSAGGVDQAVARNEMIADTINIVSTSLLGLTVGCARCHNHRYDPISQQDYYRVRAIFAPALDWKAWKRPQNRRISLYTAEDRQQAAAVEEKAKQAEAERQKILDGHLARTLDEELIKAPDELKDALRAAYQAPAKERSPEQVKLLKEYPNIQNISPGSLYLYSEQRARRANEIVSEANRKEAEFVQAVQTRALAEVSEADAGALRAALQLAADKRSGEQQMLLARHPAVAVTAENLKDFDPEGAELIARYRAAAETCRKLDSKKQLADLQQAIKDIRKTSPREYFIRALTEPQNHQPETRLFKRGNHNQPGELLEPGDLTVLHGVHSTAIPANDQELPTSGRRLAFARLLVDRRHPLVARVLVNRVWLHHFGRGIVNTPGDFGRLGERPSHPELLDWLADEFISSGWDLKHLHRVMLNSHTYRQSSKRTAELDTVDPDNRWYARQSIRRLESEAFRDAVLSVTGLLSARMFGEPVPVMEDSVGQIILGQEDLDGERKPRKAGGLGDDEHRRSLYIQQRRTRPLGVLESFDLPSVSPNCTQRPSSNVSTQALLLMNSDFIRRYAVAFAKRVVREVEPDQQVRRAWTLAYGSEPDPETIRLLNHHVEDHSGRLRKQDSKRSLDDARREALAVVCQALLGGNEFLYID